MTEITTIEELVNQGVSFRDPNKVDIRGKLECGKGVEIDINVVFEGHVILGDRVKINSFCLITDSSIDSDTQVRPFSLLQGAKIGSNTFIGPYGRVRENSVIGDDVQLGNFVEVKNVNIGAGCKINHLSFVGDTELAEGVIIGAGAITCNFDGEQSQKTIINKNAFIGSGSNLIAPIVIGENSTIASGSTITEDVADDVLAIARSRQCVKKNWQPSSKKQKKD